MIRNAVHSRNLAAVGYDPSTELLEIEFAPSKPTIKEPDRPKLATVQEFEGVPQVVVDELLAAPSLGSFFHAQIRTRYKNRRCATIAFNMVDGVETPVETRIERDA